VAMAATGATADQVARVAMGGTASAAVETGAMEAREIKARASRPPNPPMGADFGA